MSLGDRKLARPTLVAVATRAEHRAATLQRLGDAAVELYGAAAPAEPTVDEIAERAGVSRRTAFRYVEAKEDLVYVRPIGWLDVFDAAVAERPGAPVDERLRHAARAISDVIDADPEPVRAAMRLPRRVPALAARYGTVNQRWVRRVADEIAGVDPDAERRFRAHVLGAAVMGVIDAALDEWVDAEGAVVLADLVDRGLDLLAPVLAEL